jgi:hypothetical protein
VAVNGYKQTLMGFLETFSTKNHIEGRVTSIHRAAEKGSGVKYPPDKPPMRSEASYALPTRGSSTTL